MLKGIPLAKHNSVFKYKIIFILEHQTTRDISQRKCAARVVKKQSMDKTDITHTVRHWCHLMTLP